MAEGIERISQGMFFQPFRFISELSLQFCTNRNSPQQEEGSEPITGYASEGYKGKGMIQSKPSGKPLGE